MKTGFYMTKVIWYDGKDAYVSPFILRADGDHITEESRKLLDDYMIGNGEILKIELVIPIDLDGIVALKGTKNEIAYNRFKEMYF